MGCCTRLIGDPDEAFSYNTFRVVRIRDRYLGFLRFILMLLIFVYIVIKVLVIDKGYRIHDTPIGFVRTSIMMPAGGVDFTKYTFCPNSPDHSKWPFPAEADFPCHVWDADSIVYPADEVNSIFVTTRVTESKNHYNCGQQNTKDDPVVENHCENPYVEDDSTIYLLAGVTDYTLGVQHSFYSDLAQKSIVGNSKSYAGRLLDQQGNTISEFLPQSQGDIPDVMSVGQLLTAAGADIADPSRSPDSSQYYSGMVLIVLVHYSNDPHIHYEYRARAVPAADYKLYEVRYDGLVRGNRITYKRAGPKIIFMVTGDMVQFSFQTMLIQLCSALGLLSLATMAVEYVMLYVMPLRKHYAKEKFQDTDDFSHLRSQGQHRQTRADMNDLNATLIDIRETGDYSEAVRPVENY
jgi:hypothetical protein